MATHIPDRHRTNGQMAARLQDMMATCADLARRGCTVLNLSADHAEALPHIRILPPPAKARLRAEVSQRTNTGITYATELAGVSVVWTQGA